MIIQEELRYPGEGFSDHIHVIHAYMHASLELPSLLSCSNSQEGASAEMQQLWPSAEPCACRKQQQSSPFCEDAVVIQELYFCALPSL